jgi:hypothetical protein
MPGFAREMILASSSVGSKGRGPSKLAVHEDSRTYSVEAHTSARLEYVTSGTASLRFEHV